MSTMVQMADVGGTRDGDVLVAGLQADETDGKDHGTTQMESVPVAIVVGAGVVAPEVVAQAEDAKQAGDRKAAPADDHPGSGEAREAPAGLDGSGLEVEREPEAPPGMPAGAGSGEKGDAGAAAGVAGVDPSLAPSMNGGPEMPESSASPEEREFVWDKAEPPGPQMQDLAGRLAATGTVYRTPQGMIMQLREGQEPRYVRAPKDLEAIIRENFTVAVHKDGNLVGRSVPSSDLGVFLRSSVMQEAIPIVDRIAMRVTYNGHWQRTKPGYNPGPDGERYYYTGTAVDPARDPVRIFEMLGCMAFKTTSDSANAIAFALTVLLRFMWPGQKPFVTVSANKSHAGKDTTVDFAAGRTRKVEIAWGPKDWAVQNEAVSALSDPEVGVLVVGNIRSGGRIIESAFLERTVTAPDALLQSSRRRGDGYRRTGDFVVAATANCGRFSVDLTNRSLPIHLEVVGDIAARESPIGDPRREYLPAHMDEIEAELCGLIETWIEKGCPLDKTAKHPMKAWAETIGGILSANGIAGFLGNWVLERNANDATREALGLLAQASVGEEVDPAGWLRVGQIVKLAVDIGVLDVLVESRHQKTDASMERQLGVVLSSHRDEVVFFEDPDEEDPVKRVTRYRIRKARRQSSSGSVGTYYRFEAENGPTPDADTQSGSESKDRAAE